MNKTKSFSESASESSTSSTHITIFDNVTLKNKPKMKKIKKIFYTKRDFVRYHKLLWNEIIRIIKSGYVSFVIGYVKAAAFYNIFSHNINIEQNCFGC